MAVKDLKHGYVPSNSKDGSAKEAANFTSQIIILNHPGQIGNGYALCLIATCLTLLSSLLSRWSLLSLWLSRRSLNTLFLGVLLFVICATVSVGVTLRRKEPTGVKFTKAVFLL